MFLGVLLWGVYFMNFRDFFRILVSRRRSLSYQERVKNIIFRYYVFNSLSFIFLIVGACVLVFYYGFSKFMFLCALVIFRMFFRGYSLFGCSVDVVVLVVVFVDFLPYT
mgnify:CR=1 FL=1